MKRILLIMAKHPAAGATKTRLCPPFTPTHAAALYGCFLRDTIASVRRAASLTPGMQPAIAYTPDSAFPFFASLAPDFDLAPQTGALLGERLDHILTESLRRGFRQVAAVSSDSPTLPPEYMAQAFALLDDDEVDLVLGPSDDGGYYLIGVKQPQPRLLRDVQMSTPRVLQDTLVLADAAGLRTRLLPSWYDVDTIEEVARLHAELDARPGAAPHTAQFLQEYQPQLGA
jgi:rSAM/selenodomain-associated transferase 1